MSQAGSRVPSQKPQSSHSKSKDDKINNELVRASEQSKFIFNADDYPEIHWGAAYIDNKYYLAHPLALDKLLKLGQQIRIEKNKLTVNQLLDNKESQSQKDQEQNNKEQNNPQNQSIHSDINQHHNNFRPDSSRSRECKTEINQLKQLRNRIQVEKQLIVQEQKYKMKLEQMKRKRELNLKNNKNAEFIVRESQKSSKKQSKKSGFNKSNMIAPHELAANNSQNGQRVKSTSKFQESIKKNSRRYDNQEKSEKNPQLNYISFQPQENLSSPRFPKKTQQKSQISRKQKTQQKSLSKKSQLISQKIVEKSLHQMKKSQVSRHSDNKKLELSIQDKSNQSKSFVINYRKTPSNSHSRDLQDQSGSMQLRRKDLKSASSIGSKIQIEKLNRKIKQMQQKLQLIQRRQNQLQTQQMSRMKQLQATTSRLKQRMNFNSNINPDIQATKQKQENPNGGQMHIQRQLSEKISVSQQKSMNRKISQSPKLQKSHESNSLKTYSAKQVESNHQQEQQAHNSVSSNKKQQINSDQKEVGQSSRVHSQNFNILIYRNKKLNFSSSIVNYNYSEDMQKLKKAELQQFQRQRMNDEITNLKKTIRELKLQKLHHESIIEQLQVRQKEKEKQIMDVMLKNKQKQSQKNQNKNQLSKDRYDKKQIDSQQQQIVDNHVTRNQKFTHSIPSKQQNQQNNQQPRTNFYRNKMKKDDSSDLPVPKKDTFAPKKTKVEFPKYNQKDQNGKNEKDGKVSLVSKQASPKRNKHNNPEQGESQYQPSGLSRKGIIVRQVKNHQEINEDDRSDDSKFIGKKSELQPQSPRSRGNKIFELQFVRAQKQKLLAQDNDDFTLQTPTIQLQPIQIPQLPPTPSPTITQSQLIELSSQICSIFKIKNSENDLYMKKYKNCIIFKTSDHKKTVVWHYNGKFYIGGWEQNHSGEGKKTGEGYEYIPNKYSYEGQFYEGKKNGSGTMVSFLEDQKQHVYKGQWQMGEKHGIGIYYDAEDNSYYSGEFQHNKKQGKGILKFSQTQFYDGTFVKSVKEGYGVEKFSNGDMYRGEYHNGRFHGRGKYYWANGSSYDGHFIAGHREGSGKWRSSKKNSDIYIGEYQADKKEGRGQYIWNNGCRYDGMFKNDLKHGEGRVEYPDGRQIKGYWQNGKLIEIDQKITENDDSSQTDEPLRKPKIELVYESPSKQLRHSKYLQKI